MANLKIVKEKETRWDDYLEHNVVYIHTRVLNVDTNKYVLDENDYSIHAVNEENSFDEGLKIVKIDGECKAIIKWEHPYYERSGKIIVGGKKTSLDDILSVAKRVIVYNTAGKTIFEIQRMFEDYNCSTFKIKFGEKTITSMEIVSHELTEHTIFKNVYSYDGQHILSKTKKITNEEILDKIDTDDNELTR